jgi:ribosomal protein S9
MDILAKAVGRRKEAVAQVVIKKGTGVFIINNKSAQDYLHNDFNSLLAIKAPFEVLVTGSLSNTISGIESITNNSNNSHSTVSSANGSLNETNHDLGTFDQTSTNVVNSQNFSSDYDTIIKVKGGGLMGQTEAIRLGISRALCLLSTQKSNTEINDNASVSEDKMLDIRKQLKDKGYLTQDSRVKERRKYGLKKARKATQYNKR